MQIPFAAAVDTKEEGTEYVLVMAADTDDARVAIRYQFECNDAEITVFGSVAEMLEEQYDGFAKLTTI